MFADIDPGQVFMGGGGRNRFFLGPQNVQQDSGQGAQANTGPLGTLGAEAIRATGTGPFDDAYRQNLATYAGGLFSRPGGFLGFNPTGTSLFGAPTGGGNAPVPGTGMSLYSQALGGNPFSVPNPPPPQVPTADDAGWGWQDWVQ